MKKSILGNNGRITEHFASVCLKFAPKAPLQLRHRGPWHGRHGHYNRYEEIEQDVKIENRFILYIRMFLMFFWSTV